MERGMYQIGQAIAQIIRNKRNEEMNFKASKAQVLGQIAEQTGKVGAYQAYTNSLSDLFDMPLPNMFLPSREGPGSMAITGIGSPASNMTVEDRAKMLDLPQEGISVKPNLTEIPSTLGYAVNLPPGAKQYTPPQKDTLAWHEEQIKREMGISSDVIGGLPMEQVRAEALRRYAPMAEMQQKVNNLNLALKAMGEAGLPETYKTQAKLNAFGIDLKNPMYDLMRQKFTIDAEKGMPIEKTMRDIEILLREGKWPTGGGRISTDERLRKELLNWGKTGRDEARRIVFANNPTQLQKLIVGMNNPAFLESIDKEMTPEERQRYDYEYNNYMLNKTPEAIKNEYIKIRNREQENIPAPTETGQSMQNMPLATQHLGRIIKDTTTGKRYKSDGKQWLEIQ